MSLRHGGPVARIAARADPGALSVPCATVAAADGCGGGVVAEQTWLDVPYDDRQAATAAGARWDPAARAWYAGPGADPAALARWAPCPPLPALLPGEDRGFGSGLFVDLIPASCWFTNVRTCVSAGDWDRVRRMVYGRAGQRCEACGRGPDPAAELRLEAHERWAYDTAAGVQRLARLICLCSDCHAVTHFGLTALRGREEWALTHLQAVTGLDPVRAIAHVEAAFLVWEVRSAQVWSLDLSMLTGAGITLAAPPGAAERAAHAERTIAADPDATAQAAGTPRVCSVAGGNVAGGNVPAHQGAAGGDRLQDGPELRDAAAGADRVPDHGCGVTITEYAGLPVWALNAPIEEITFHGPTAAEQRAALLEIRAEIDRAYRPAPTPPPLVPAAPTPHVPAAPVDPRRVVPPAARAPRRARWWRRP